MITNLDNETIKDDVNNEEESLDEDRTVGTSDESDDDPDDTTPAEAEEQANEGEEIVKRMRNKNKGEDL